MQTGPAENPLTRCHPCFSREAHFKYGRIHLAVAPRCNIQCAYCDRRFDCPNESRPGVSSRILTPMEALDRVEREKRREPRLQVVGIAGPGDPLANDATFETLRLVRSRFPELSLCLSTNGLVLSDRLPELLDCGVTTLTITMNALTLPTALRLYEEVRYGTEPLSREEGCRLLLDHQREGLAKAAEAGLAIKVNTVLVPGINDGEVERLAETVSKAGAILMNLMPLIPQARLSSCPAPTGEALKAFRDRAEVYLPQFRHCKQCRADAAGVPGEGDFHHLLELQSPFAAK